MDPKVQSSFIPRNSVIPDSAGTGARRESRAGGLFSFIALIIFILSILIALGVFGYKFYLKYRIGQMETGLQNAEATIQLDIIRELVNLDNRIISTKSLVLKHISLTPLFQFLEVSTPKTVRFSDFRYSTTDNSAINLTMRGEARGYTALAVVADVFSKSQYFKNPNFSNLVLNEKGDVTFSFEATIDPSLVSYNRVVENLYAPLISTTTPQI